ncbi:Inositol polyphosphate 5-phosphatase OCRL [Taenia solium]|eukprot:TsM_000219000 transcript=TsM_000219000 gene=TsM_000219000
MPSKVRLIFHRPETSPKTKEFIIFGQRVIVGLQKIWGLFGTARKSGRLVGVESSFDPFLFLDTEAENWSIQQIFAAIVVLSVFEGESCDISLDVCVSPDVVATVQSGVSLLSCIIVLTLVGGKDFFISINGRFVPTSFGLPLTLLLRLPATPVALLPPDHIAQLIRESRVGNWSDGEPSVVVSTSGPIFVIPKEIYRLTDFIAARLEEPGLFRQPEMRCDLPIIRDTLDTTKHDIPIPSTVSVHSVIYSLLVFLSALPEPVVPFAFQSNCIAAARQATSNILSAYQAISRLPIDYQNLFFYLVSFIKQCLSHSDKNGTNVEMLGVGDLVDWFITLTNQTSTTFADIILRDPPLAASPPTAPGVRNGPTRSANIHYQQQQTVLSRHELKTVFLRIFITSDTEEVIRRLKQA